MQIHSRNVHALSSKVNKYITAGIYLMNNNSNKIQNITLLSTDIPQHETTHVRVCRLLFVWRVNGKHRPTT